MASPAAAGRGGVEAPKIPRGFVVESYTIAVGSLEVPVAGHSPSVFIVQYKLTMM